MSSGPRIGVAGKMLASCRMRDVRTTLMALRLQAIPTGRQELSLADNAPYLLLSLHDGTCH